jgi:hypothetical protein
VALESVFEVQNELILILLIVFELRIRLQVKRGYLQGVLIRLIDLRVRIIEVVESLIHKREEKHVGREAVFF